MIINSNNDSDKDNVDYDDDDDVHHHHHHHHHDTSDDDDLRAPGEAEPGAAGRAGGGGERARGLAGLADASGFGCSGGATCLTFVQKL